MKQFLAFLLLTIRTVAQPPVVPMNGRITGYVANRIGDYEGLRLQLATGDVALRFPPHAASQVLKIGPVGQRVDADVRPPHPDRNGSDWGRSRRGHGHPNQYWLLRLTQSATGATLDLGDMPPPPPRTGTLVQITGRLTGTLTDERGQLVGLLIDKTYLLELRPHQSDLLRPLLGTVQEIGFSGYQRPPAGFVNQTGRAVVRPQSITIDGRTYAF